MGTRVPEYANRLQGADYHMELTEVPLGQRSGADVARAIAAEGGRMLAAAGERCYLVALQVRGESWSTARLARWLDERAREGDPIAFCIGGPDGRAGETTPGRRVVLHHYPAARVASVVAARALYPRGSLIKPPYHRHEAPTVSRHGRVSWARVAFTFHSRTPSALHSAVSWLVTKPLILLASRHPARELLSQIQSRMR